MLVSKAQSEMRHAYYGGAPGIVASAAAWLAAALVAARDPERAMWVLFAGGMLIHPIAVLLCRALGRPTRHSRDNPFGALALATTAWLIFSLPLAYGVARLNIAWFFPAMLLVIGGRYMTFATIYGGRAYWTLGGALALAGYLLAWRGASPFAGALAGGAIELVFAIAVFVAARKELAQEPMPA